MVSLYPLFTSLNAHYEQSKLEKELASQIAQAETTDTQDPGQSESPIVENQVRTSSATLNTTENQELQPPVPAKPVEPTKEIKALMRLEIPSIRLSSIVVKGTTPRSLSQGPGWYEESVYPGEGNTAIAAHNNMYGSWFRNIKKLQAGSEIFITYKGKKYTYSVLKVFPIAINDWSVIAPTSDVVLTLTTCHTATERLACRAVLKGTSEI